ncbi:hypothetical protein [Aeromonas molluscorum]|uniref:DUF4276 family protein n=1 Tax=Aeromonas molluscorum 848 TaxID=1268236 RepID=R1GVE9_9GAMM|nr:hypothetical protein [Aeromonas molluscorum]EOD55560.1 hypothetical protein G113_08335 [Aeromonas molluscorum 848]
MSDLRIALVAEGPTDYVIIEAALKAFLPNTFIMTQLQPEATQPEMGGGWGGVLKWCHAASQRHAGPIDQEPTLAGYDLLIIHLDVDVAAKEYSNCGPTVEALAQASGWRVLPCAQVCPPVADTCRELQSVLESWLMPATFGQHSLPCLPAQSSGTWLAAAVLSATHRLLGNAECDPSVEDRLAQLPKVDKIRKTPREYRLKAPQLTANWQAVKTICSQAQVFEDAVLAAI